MHKARLPLITIIISVPVFALSGWGLALDPRFLLFAFLPFLPLIISRPVYSLSLVTLVWSIYWLPGVTSSHFEALKDSILGIFFFGLLLYIVINRISLKKLFSNTTFRLLLFFIIASTPSVFYSPDISSSILIWIRLITALLLYSTVFMVFVEKLQSPQYIFNTLAIPVVLSCGLVLSNLLGIVPPFSPPEQYSIRFPELVGFTYRELGLAWIIAYVVPIFATSTGYHLIQKRSLGIFFGLTTGLLIMIAWLTGGRGGILASIFAVGVCLFVFFPSRTVILTILVVIIISILPISNNIKNKFLYRNTRLSISQVEEIASQPLSFGKLDAISSGRLSIYEAALVSVRDNPLLGAGLGNLPSAMIENELGIRKAGHNLYIGTIAESGLFAAFAAVSFMGHVIYTHTHSLIQKKGRDDIYSIIAVAILWVGLLSTTVEMGSIFRSIYTGLPFWIGLAYLEGTRNTYEAPSDNGNYTACSP